MELCSITEVDGARWRKDHVKEGDLRSVVGEAGKDYVWGRAQTQRKSLEKLPARLSGAVDASDLPGRSGTQALPLLGRVVESCWGVS